MRKKPDSLCTSKIIFALSLGLCFLGITSALTIPDKNAEHKPFFEGIKIVVSGDNNNEMIEKTGANNILWFDNGIATIRNIQDYTDSYASLFGGSGNEMVKSATAVIFGGEKNRILTGGDKAYIIGGDTQKIQTTDPTYYIGGKNNGVTTDRSNNDHGIFIGGQNNKYIGENKNYISIIANNDKRVTKENSLLIHNITEGTNNITTIKNTFFYNNQENAAQNNNAAEFYSENGLQINTASSVSGITINAGGSFQMVPKDINDENNLITKAGSCNPNRNGLYEVVSSGENICIFYCNGHDWKDAFSGVVTYTGTDGNTETRQNNCTSRLGNNTPKGDCVISGGMTIANGMTAELYIGDYPKCKKFIGTCKNGKIQDEKKKDVNEKQLRHICEAATGRCQATTEQREKQLIDENAIPCSGINFTTPGNKAIVLTGQCPQTPAANTCPYYCKEGYRPYDSGSGTKCEEVFKIVFTGTSVTTGEIIFAGRKEAKNFIYSGQNRTGYTFTGWKNFSTTDAINTKGKFKSESDKTKIQGGTMVTGGTVEYFYEMMGDFDDKSYLTGEYVLTLTGLWEPNTYTINFSGNGGVFQDKKSNGSITCNYDNIQYNYDDLYRLTGTPSLHCDLSAYNNPTKTGYTFVGWEIQGMDDKEVHYLYSDSNCATLFADPTTTSYNDFSIYPDNGTNIQCVKNLTAQKNGSITFIAHWRPNKLIVNYYGNGADYAYSGTRQLDSKSNTLLPPQNGIPNPHVILYDNNAVPCDYPYDYKWPRSFSLSKSGYQGSGTYDVYLGTKITGQLRKTIPQDICTNPHTITAPELANRLGVLSELEKGDITVSLYAGWEKCAAGYYCPADQEPQKCPGDMTSAPGAYKIEQCYTKEPCSKGRYLPANGSTCAPCPEGSYCPDQKTYYYSGTNQGKTACPNGYTSAEGSTNQHQCYITCDLGTFVTTKYGTCNGRCGKGEYINDPTKVHYGDTNACTKCTENVQNGQFTTPNSCNFKCNEPDYEKTSDGKACQLAKIHCDPGYYLPANSRTCQICEAGYYCPGGYYYPSPSTYQGKNQCQNAGNNGIPAHAEYSQKQSNPICSWSCERGYQKRGLGGKDLAEGGRLLDDFCTPRRIFNAHIIKNNDTTYSIRNDSSSGIKFCEIKNTEGGNMEISRVCPLFANCFNYREQGNRIFTEGEITDIDANKLYCPSNNTRILVGNTADYDHIYYFGYKTGGTLDLNGYHNGEILGNKGRTSPYGHCDLYLDGVKVGINLQDFSAELPMYTQYEFICHTSSDNYTVSSTNHKGTIKNSTTTKVSFNDIGGDVGELQREEDKDIARFIDCNNDLEHCSYYSNSNLYSPKYTNVPTCSEGIQEGTICSKENAVCAKIPIVCDDDSQGNGGCRYENPYDSESMQDFLRYGERIFICK